MNGVGFGFVVMSVAVAVAPIAWAQPKVDFSGTWKLDEAKSGPAAGGERPRSGTLRIEQTDTELRVSASGDATLTMIYRLDGSESVNKVGGGTVTSTTTWDGPRLAVRSSWKFALTQGDLTIDGTEVYSISKSVLTITSTGPLMPGERPRTTTLVFTKQ